MTDSPCPASPWKRPKVVSLTKTKSIKRRSEIFAAHNANNDSFGSSPAVPRMLESSIVEENDFAPQAAKVPKTVLNRFSVKSKFNFNGSNENSFNNSMNLNESGNASLNEKNNDLSSFFSGTKDSKFDGLTYEERMQAEKKLQPNQYKKADTATSFCPAVINNLKSGLIFSDGSPLAASKTKVEETETFNYEHGDLVPVDWSLKTRCRFLSMKPFSCNAGIKSSHESEAISNYAYFKSFYANLENSQLNSVEDNKNLYKTLLNESVSYWTFPYLPWINLYPRNSSFGNLSTMLEPLHPEIQKSLLKSWNQSFKSLYNSLKSNECPYFYVLTHSFIVMFKAENIGTSSGEMHAILTPSTKGLRQALADITFTMPLSTKDINQANTSDLANSMEQSDRSNILSEKADSNSNNEENDSGIKNAKVDSNSNSNDMDDDEEMDEVNDEPDEWLEKMGLDSAVNFKASVLQRNSKDQKKNQFLNFDNRPRSTLLFMQGSEVQALFNFLLNSKTCVTNSGPLTGIPPTLIAPTTFVGATLQKNRIEQNIVKSLNSEGNPITQYALDFIGPIMPYHVHRLCNLFKETNGQFDMVANTYESSAALNCVKSSKDGADEHEGQQTNQKPTQFLDKSELLSLESSHGIFGESNALKSISYKENKFCCNY